MGREQNDEERKKKDTRLALFMTQHSYSSRMKPLEMTTCKRQLGKIPRLILLFQFDLHVVIQLNY